MQNASRSIQELLEPCDAARLLGLMPSSIHRLTERGELPLAARTPRGTRLYRQDDVERLRERRACRG